VTHPDSDGCPWTGDAIQPFSIATAPRMQDPSPVRIAVCDRRVIGGYLSS